MSTYGNEPPENPYGQNPPPPPPPPPPAPTFWVVLCQG